MAGGEITKKQNGSLLSHFKLKIVKRSMKPYIKIILSTCMVLYVIFIVSCKKEYNDKPFYETNNESIIEYIRENADTFSLFLTLIEESELESTLAAYNPFGNGYTLFLPSNRAINKFIEANSRYSSFQDLLNDNEFVRTLVRFHIANIGLNTNDFPFGALPDTTLSGDLLTIGFSGEIDSLVQQVNNYASITYPNIYLTNGYIHIIDEVLRPIVFTSYEWFKNEPDFSIFTRALELTNLKEVFTLDGDLYSSPKRANTVLVEPDNVFNEDSIFSVDDLINRYSPDDQNYTSNSNGLYQFVSYHILEGRMFLNNFEDQNTNFNTYAYLPVAVNATGIDIKINTGVEIFDTVVNGGNIKIIDYISIQYDKSNVITKNGAIHIINHVMELFKPKPQQRTFQFYEEPLINLAAQSPNTYEFKDPDLFEVIGWEGVDKIKFVKSMIDLTGVSNNDYIELEGAFSISYEIPKILPGNYMLRFKANSDHADNAFVQLFIDGKRIGGNIDLTSAPGSQSFYTYDIGQLSFINFEKHLLKIQTLIPGRLQWDAVIFQPVTNK